MFCRACMAFIFIWFKKLLFDLTIFFSVYFSGMIICWFEPFFSEYCLMMQYKIRFLTRKDYWFVPFQRICLCPALKWNLERVAHLMHFPHKNGKKSTLRTSWNHLDKRQTEIPVDNFLLSRKMFFSSCIVRFDEHIVELSFQMMSIELFVSSFCVKLTCQNKIN